MYSDHEYSMPAWGSICGSNFICTKYTVYEVMGLWHEHILIADSSYPTRKREIQLTTISSSISSFQN
uniref:Uncharacterized protein n=1 Tax=Setaria italica TaxID=4555 RepID=K3Y0P1_SETIT